MQRENCRFEPLEIRLAMSAASAIKTPWDGDADLQTQHADHDDTLLRFAAGDKASAGRLSHELIIDEALLFFEAEMAGASGASTTTSISGANVPLSSIPALHSYQGAPVTVYLDFDGHFESVWGGYSNISTPVFNTDADATTYSAAEITAITDIWKRVAEDYAAFNIDVTTVRPNSFADGQSLLVSIGGDGAWLGAAAGGVAYINSFTSSYLANTVYVFPQRLANSARYIAEAASHEAGHGFGLYHQSLYDASGKLVKQYNDGNSQWAPIMGVGYYSAQTLWHNGPNSNGPTSYQDDLAVLTRTTNRFGYRQDDHGNDFANASSLAVSNGQVSAAGIIERTTDVDMFSFDVPTAGQVQLNLNVADLGANLDIAGDLFTSTGQLITSTDPTTTLTASITTTLSAGTYFLGVRSSSGYGEIGQYTISGTVPANHAPDLAALADLTMAHRQGSVVVQLSATDADGDPITFSATARQVDLVAERAYQLRQQYGLTASTSEYYNSRGLREKYLRGSGGAWFYILPNGELYRWNGSIASSPKVGTLDARFHSNLSLLYNAQRPAIVSLPGTIGISGNSLTIDPADGVTGTYQVDVTASDGRSSDSHGFVLTITNNAPVLDAIANQTMSPSEDKRSIQLSTSDADGDPISYTARAWTVDAKAQLAYQLDRQYGFVFAGSEYYNLRGQGEKYFQGNGSVWHFILADGRVYRWGGSIAGSTLLGTLDGSFHTNLSKVYAASVPGETPANVNVSVVGSTLTLDPAGGFLGDFGVTVVASDGANSDSKTFAVNVANAAPTIAPIDDQTMLGSQDQIAVSVAATDPDGDAVTLSAQAAAVDPVRSLAYQLDRQYDFSAATSDYLNARGLGEKYFRGAGGSWFYILSNGRVYRWAGSIAASPLLGTLDNSYYTNLSKLHNVSTPNASVSVGLSISGNTLSIDPATGYLGAFRVTVTASDGRNSNSTSFQVSVTSGSSTAALSTAASLIGIPARSFAPAVAEQAADARAEVGEHDVLASQDIRLDPHRHERFISTTWGMQASEGSRRQIPNARETDTDARRSSDVSSAAPVASHWHGEPAATHSNPFGLDIDRLDHQLSQPLESSSLWESLDQELAALDLALAEL